MKSAFIKEFSRFILLFSATLIAALIHINKSSQKPFFYQSYFEPAVMLACGRGYTTDLNRQISPSSTDSHLTDFLNAKTEKFDCSYLPEKINPTNLFGARPWYYMMHMTGYLWKVTGVRWSVLDKVVAVFFAISACLVYALLRLVSGPLAAAIPTIFFALSPLQKEYLAYFRDYSKTPFILASLFLLSCSIKYQLSQRYKILLAAAVGFTVAIGYGFRTDLMVVVPFAVMVFLLFQPEGIRRQPGLRLGMVFSFLTSFTCFAYPIIKSNMTMGGCSWHFAISGLSDTFNESLGLTSPLYRWMFEYNDRSAAFAVLSHGDRIFGIQRILMCSPTYDLVSKNLFFEFVKTFPEDFLKRFFATIPVILNERNLFGTNLFLVALAFPALWVSSRRMALFFLAVITYFCGYSCIQFQQRHYFYLEFILWWSASVLISAIYGRTKAYRSKEKSLLRFAPSQLKTLLVAIAVIIGSLGIMWHIIGKIQGKQTMRLASNLENLRRENFPARFFQKGENLVVDLNDFPHKKYEPELIIPELAVVRLKSENCKNRSFKMRLQYSTKDQNYNLSRNIPINLLAGEKGRNVYLPLFYRADSQNIAGAQKMVEFSHPSEILIPSENKDCFDGVDRVIDRTSVPLWIDFSVPNNVQPQDLKLKFKHGIDLTAFIKHSPAKSLAASTTKPDKTLSCSVVNKPFPPAGQYGDLCSVSLTAGTWSCSLLGVEAQNGATATNFTQFGIGTVTGNNCAWCDLGVTACAFSLGTNLGHGSCTIPAATVNIPQTTTFYAKAYANYSSGTPRAYAQLSCRKE